MGVDRYSCEEVFRRLDAFVDRELRPDELALVEAHIATCEACAREYRFESRVLGDVRGKLRRIDVPPSLSARIATALRAAAEAEARAAAAAAPPSSGGEGRVTTRPD
jgi:anti-sigma factor (TIGR02949 family)